MHFVYPHPLLLLGALPVHGCIDASRFRVGFWIPQHGELWANRSALEYGVLLSEGPFTTEGQPLSRWIVSHRLSRLDCGRIRLGYRGPIHAHSSRKSRRWDSITACW